MIQDMRPGIVLRVWTEQYTRLDHCFNTENATQLMISFFLRDLLVSSNHLMQIAKVLLVQKLCLRSLSA